ncbi:hypothetical protein [Mesorhizobium sp.]|uniref:hypothetical protein n=1 Tax=Mesorhizobium sp. TaxID=1871066 RepID=UPI0025C64B7F|nr:hypothetical protein [Mesorhizobium sp.]
MAQKIDRRKRGNPADERGKYDQPQIMLMHNTIIDGQHLASPDLPASIKGNGD